MDYFLCNINYPAYFANSFFKGGSKAIVSLVLSNYLYYICTDMNISM